MKILSIDVGIKNLAICIIETIKEPPYYNILYWHILNLCEEINTSCDIKTNNKICIKQAKFIKNDINYCKLS